MATITIDVELNEFSDSDLIEEIKYRLTKERFKDKWIREMKRELTPVYAINLDEHYKIKAFVHGKDKKSVSEIESFFGI